MEFWKIVFVFITCLILTACSELLYCPNPSQVALVEKLPSACCEYKGLTQANFCPDGTYSHKLQCLAAKQGGNVIVLTKMHNGISPAYPVYDCKPGEIFLPTRCDNTDVSNSCAPCP